MKISNEKTVYVGALGLMEYFKFDGQEYRTITYPPMNTCPTNGTRWCLNMKTLKARYFLCREKVVKVPHGT
jgi:hypothetical protein